jgi:hypothetical protein
MEPVTDDELTACALAADPETTVGGDAVCLWDVIDERPSHRLPAWYMPSPMGTHRFTGWRLRVARCSVGLIVGSLLAINAAGLCNTYGQLHL